MYLSEVRIKNFRNLKSLTAKFSKGLNVIVGENNIGKLPPDFQLFSSTNCRTQDGSWHARSSNC